jgi:hypothetical protein
MVQSVERACQRVEGEEVGCICGGTSPKADSSMLHCGSCEEWYAVVALFTPTFSKSMYQFGFSS